jgi:NSS family neurotransmitter:Na+ symporter
MMLAMLGMAVGTGNIWRFPRIAATNGGGSFLVAWVVFLLLWSVPLILVEFAMGKAARRGTVGAFARIAGERYAWMGGWVAWCTVAILFYYSVVMGWCLRFLIASATSAVGWSAELPGTAPGALWTSFTGSGWQPLLMHAAAIALGAFVVARGVRGIERAARVLMPCLFLLVVLLAIRALTLPGAERGLNFLFTPNWSDLADYRIWIAALTQNAWDTGAGWGLILTYAVYLRAREDTALNGFLLGFGNNSVSLLAGILVLCTVFAIRPDAASEIVGAGNEGLTFIWVPQLFATMPAGGFFMILFFLALFFAAWTSLISMVELAVRVLVDAGARRTGAIRWVAIAGFLCGAPSALSLRFFGNQDFVWGVGLMLSGFFFAFAVVRYGVRRFREEFVNGPGSDIRIGRWWDYAIVFCLVEAAVLVVWWFAQAAKGGWAAALDPFSSFSVGTVLLQWGVVLAVLIALNRWLVRRSATPAPGADALGPPPASIP